MRMGSNTETRTNIKEWYVGGVTEKYMGSKEALVSGDEVLYEHSNGRTSFEFTKTRLIIRSLGVGKDCMLENFTLPYKSIVMWEEENQKEQGTAGVLTIWTHVGKIILTNVHKSVLTKMKMTLDKECV